MSFFPLLICINAFVGASQLDRTYFISLLEGFVPLAVIEIMGEYAAHISENNGTAFLIIGVVTMVTSSSGAFRAIMKIMEDIYGCRRYVGIANIAVSAVMSLAFLITLYLGIIVVITGTRFLTFIDVLFRLNGALFNWQWLRFLIFSPLVFLVISALYKAAVPKREASDSTFLGAFAAAFLLSAATMLFSYLIGLSSKYSLIYGSLSSVIIIMLWLYIIGNLIILGSIFNFVLEKNKITLKFMRKKEDKKSAP